MSKTMLALPFGLMVMVGCASNPSHADTPSAGESTMVGAPNTTTGSTPSGTAGSNPNGPSATPSTSGVNGSSGATTGGPGNAH